MKINNINRFQVNPVSMDHPRSKIGRDYSNSTTFLTGDLVPIYVHECLPGETLSLKFSSVLRAMTPAVPVMDNAFVDYYFFFVPSRLCTYGEKDWQKICNENTSGYWAPNTETTCVNSGNSINIKDLSTYTLGSVQYKVAPQSLLNYLGAPILPSNRVGTGATNTSGVINTLVPRAYFKIWNEWFRDENTQAPKDFDSNKNYLGLPSSAINTCVLKVNKYHDLFTSSMPSPQKGDSVMLPLGTMAPVITTDTEHDLGSTSSPAFGLTWRYTNGNRPVTSTSGSAASGLTMIGEQFPNVGIVTSTKESDGTIDASESSPSVHPSNLWTDLSQTTAASVNELRNAFAIQRLLEKDARGGTRYFETLMSHFGVSNPDLVLQRPEYLAGKRVPITIQQVLQNSESSTTPLGTTGAFSNTCSSDHMFTKSFGEYGYVIGLAAVRTSQSYSQGLPKYMLRNRRFDWYWEVFANLGEQPIKKKELYFGNSSSDNEAVFGYQEAWADYRYQSNKLSGFLGADSPDTDLDSWTYKLVLQGYPTLNSSFMVQPADQFGFTLADTNAIYHFLANFYFEEKLALPMPLYSIPGLIDHH